MYNYNVKSSLFFKEIMMPKGIYPRKPFTEEHKTNIRASKKKFYQEHPAAGTNHSTTMKKILNSPKVLELIQQYGSPLINKLRQKYSDLNIRCNDSNPDVYKYYGGRGIQNLFTSVEHFLNYVILELDITTLKQIDGLDIDRIDNDGNYEPGNIRFVTRKVNRGNRRDSKND